MFCCGFFCVLHCSALWNGFLHHVLVHIVAVHCCVMCLVGLSELHLVHRGLFFVVCCCSWLCVVFSFVLIGVLHLSVL